MFKLQPAPTFAGKVSITVPGGTSIDLPVVFKHMTASAFARFLADAENKTNADMVTAMIAECREVPDGTSLAEFFDQLFENYPASAADLFRTYRRELLESRVKN